MTTPASDHRTLAGLISQSLDLADALGLALVALSLNEALERLQKAGHDAG